MVTEMPVVRSRVRPVREGAVKTKTKAEILADAALRLQTCHGVAELPQAIAESYHQVLDSHQVAVMRFEHDRARPLWISPPFIDPTLSHLSGEAVTADRWPVLRRMISDHQPWRGHLPGLDNAPTADLQTAEFMTRIQVSAMMATPVVVGGSLWGVVVTSRRNGRFTTEDQARATVLNSLISAALIRVDFENQVLHLMAEDPLTGLADRRVADAAAETALASGVETCIVMCDVDGLKQVNDRLGHGEGDELLRNVADVLRRVADALPGTTVARIGGDEFCLVVPGWPRPTVEEAIIGTLDANQLPHDAAISWGVAARAVGEQTTINELFRSADFAQYHRKRARARRRQLSVPVAADPMRVVKQLLDRAVSAIAAADGPLARVCALASVAADTLAGAEWTVLWEVEPGLPPVPVARGGSPSGDDEHQYVVSVELDGWRIDFGSSTPASLEIEVHTALRASLFAAISHG